MVSSILRKKLKNSKQKFNYMNFKQILLVTAIMVGGYNTTKGQESMSFTLKDAIDYALKNNVQVKNALIDIEVAKKKIWETTAQGLPQVSASLDYTYMPTIPEMKFQTPYLINPALSDGTNADKIQMGYMTVPIKLGVESSATIKANVSQLVFNGSYIVGLQTANIFKKLSEQALTSTENSIRENVSNSYYLVLMAQSNLEVITKMKENLEKTLAEMKAFLNEGLIENTDVDQFQYTVTMVENTKKNIERQAEIAMRLLKFQMGIELEKNIVLTENLNGIVQQLNIESLMGSEFDVKQNVNYQLMKTQEKMMKMSLNLQKSTYLPSVVAFYSHQEKTAKADFDFTFPDMVGVSVNVPVFSSGMRMSRVGQAKLQLEKTQNSTQMATEGLKLEYEKAKSQLLSSFDKYINEKTNMDLAEKIYNKTLIKYKEGISGSMDLTQANSQLLTSQTNYYSALYELLTSKTKLENLMNKQ